ncbi:MAG: hypothetical protein H7062_25490 [Candidatus Saccharimonas sp.]|nr:hypothetical protein [Planctomycetaceae bacterium]
MTEDVPPRLTLRQRWHRLRTSPRFPFVLFLGLFALGGLWQAYSYWWGVRIHNMAARHGGSAQTRKVYPHWLTDRIGWRNLQPLEPINNLRLQSPSPILASDIALLEGLWELNQFSCWGPIEPNGWRHLSRLRGLKYLSMSGSHWCVHEADFEQIARLPKLERMNLNEVAIESRGLRHLARHPALLQLVLQTVPESSGSIDATPIELEKSPPQVLGAFDVASLREFAAQPTLVELELLNSPGFGDAHLLALTSILPDGTKPLPSLKNLTLHKASLTRDGLRHLANLRSLECLELDFTGLGDGGLRFLKYNPTIQQLDVHGTRIGDSDVETMLTMPALATVHVNRTRITERGLKQLATHPHLKCLYVGGDVSMTTVAELRARVHCVVGY